MTTRRQFIHTSLALAAVPSAAFAATPAATEMPVLSLERFVFDSRFERAAEVARHVAARGVPLSAIAGDLTDLWYHELDLRWKRAPEPLAGITTPQGLFVFATLAADHRMRVVYRGEHRTAADGRVRHALAGPDDLVARIGEAPREMVWATLGAAMVECPAHARLAAAREPTNAATRAPLGDEPLCSWIIAPRAATTTR